MDLICTDCGTTYYSAAARSMVDRGERCDECGGELRLAEAFDRLIAVGTRGRPGNGRGQTLRARRFTRG